MSDIKKVFDADLKRLADLLVAEIEEARESDDLDWWLDCRDALQEIRQELVYRLAGEDR